MALNWNEFNKAVSQSKRAGRRTRRFNIRNGESVPLKFLVNENEPYIFKRHYANAARKYLVCAEDAANAGTHDGCVACYEARKKRNGPVRGAARVYGFSVYDPRKYHIVENIDDKYQPCSEDAKCKWCRQGIEVRTTGVCHWTVAEAVATQLRQFELDLLGTRCASCGLGTVKVVEFVCPDCEDPVESDDPSQPSKCYNCGGGKTPKLVMPQEVLSCSKCKSPKRMTLSDVWVIVTRSGEGTQTSYNFAPGEVADLPEGVTAESVNFAEEEDFRPVSAVEQAAILGVPNPFRSSGSRAAAEDDEAEEPKNPAFQMREPKNPFFRR